MYTHPLVYIGISRNVFVYVFLKKERKKKEKNRLSNTADNLPLHDSR